MLVIPSTAVFDDMFNFFSLNNIEISRAKICIKLCVYQSFTSKWLFQTHLFSCLRCNLRKYLQEADLLIADNTNLRDKGRKIVQQLQAEF